jgi:uncharacterized protein YjbJ (UPF0337 family)
MWVLPEKRLKLSQTIASLSGFPGMDKDITPAVKSKFSRRNTMKASTKDQVEGKFHEVKGKVKEVAGKLSDNPQLEAEGTIEKLSGKIQEKIGQVKEVLRK